MVVISFYLFSNTTGCIKLRLKKEYSYTSTTPMGLRGMY